jgi:methylglyoxal synthase
LPSCCWISDPLSVGEVDILVFQRAPMTAQPHEPDNNALLPACDVHNVLCATNVETARVLLGELRVQKRFSS